MGPVNTFFYLGGQMNGTQLASWTDGSIVDYKGQWQAGEPNVDSSNTCTMVRGGEWYNIRKVYRPTASSTTN